MRLAAIALGLAVALTTAACGSSDSGGSSGETLEELWKRPGDDVGLVQGTSDYAPGSVRVSFLVIREDGQLVERPRAKVWLARGLEQRPVQETTASLEPIGVEGGDSGDLRYIYVATLDVPSPGKWWFVAEPVGGQRIQGLGTLVVGEETASPAVGEAAPRSETPTLESTGGDLEALSTAADPEPELYRSSVAQALEAGDPFVVAFATPRFCQSRACGPTVEVVDAVRGRFAGDGVRFMHVEVYRDNDPQKGVNRWMEEWRLPTEPWVFVVDGDGRIAAKFEGSVSVEELTAAVERVA